MQLDSSQLILMFLCFAGMLSFAMVALWLWKRPQGSRARPPQAESRSQVRHGAATEPAPPEPEPAPPEPEPEPAPPEPEPAPPEPEPAPPEPEPADPYDATEFIALPGRRDLDAPRQDHERTAIVESLPEQPTELAPPADGTALLEPHFPAAEDEAPAEATAIIPAAERTAMLPALELEALHRPSPKSPPAPVAGLVELEPAAPSFDLRQHFRLAVDAFERIQHTSDAEALERWRGHLTVLSSAPADELLSCVNPVLEADASDHRWHAALLTLLHNKAWPSRRAFAELLGELDAERVHQALRVLGSWDDARAQSIAKVCMSASAGSQDLHVAWLERFAERGWAVDAETLEAALADDDPRVISAGLRLLPRSDPLCGDPVCGDPCRPEPGPSRRDPASRTAKLAGHLFAPNPRVRMQAIETALAFSDHSAWLVCRQLARNPKFPLAAELVGLLGTEAEITELRRALDTAPTPQLLWALGLSGRRAAIEACADHLEDTNPGVREAAREGLATAAGRSLESSTEAHAWLASSLPLGGGDPGRLLGGAQRTPAQVMTVLRDAPERLRQALARELWVRSGGRLHLDTGALPHAWRRQLDTPPGLDLERGFPWAEQHTTQDASP